MKKWYAILGTLAVIAAFIGIGAFGVFSDTESAVDNTFTAGTLDLKVDNNDDPNVVSVSLSNMKPGDKHVLKWCLKNAGTIAGTPSVEFSAITNEENGENEPETEAEGALYAGNGYAGTTLGRAEGELGQYLKTNMMRGPCGWSVGSQHFGPGIWGTGPATSWGTWGLDGYGGGTYDMGITLGPGEEIGYFLYVELAEDLVAWDGVGSHDIDDNVIQSDAVEFDLMFRLAQAE